MQNREFVKKPWGNYERFTHNEISTVKILTLQPDAILSYQYHFHREEFWKVIDGEGFAIINDKRIELKKGDEVFIKKKDKHRLGAITNMQVLEISFGTFDEEDIVRLEDEYDRITNA